MRTWNRNILPEHVKRALKSTLFGLMLTAGLTVSVFGGQAADLAGDNVPEAQAAGLAGDNVPEAQAAGLAGDDVPVGQAADLAGDNVTGSRAADLPGENISAVQELGPVDMDVVYGYQNTAKSGRFLPLRISLKNRGQEEFNGTLCILAMESDFQGYNLDMDYDVYRYEYPVTIQGTGSFSQAVSVSLGARVDQVYVRLLDENGEQLTSKRLKLNLNLETAELFIGVLSDTPSKLLYLNGAGINYSTLRTRFIEMSVSSFPSDQLGLDQLDVLVISNFDTGRLSGQQTEALWEWVQKGGILLLGTGARGEDTLRAFKKELLEQPLPQPDQYVVNMGVEYAVDDPEGASIPLTCTDVVLRGGVEILSSDELSVLSYAPVGNGLAAVAIYDFADIEKFCQENISYIDNLFTKLMGEERINALSRSMDGSASSQFWSVQSLINTGDINRLPQVGLYMVLSVAYVVLAGPGLYFFMKQRGLQRYYQSSVALLSLCCTGMVILMGTATRFEGPFFTYATVKDTEAGGVTETTFINMRTPYNKPYSVEFNPSYSLQPVTGSAYYDIAPAPKFTGEEEPAITIRYEEDVTRVKADHVGAFNSKYFMMERHGANEKKEGFTGDIHLFEGKVTGTLTNHYDQEVEDVAILMFNEMILIDRMAPGETVALDNQKVIYGSANMGYALAEQITGASRYKEDKNLKDPEYVKALERTNLLSFYMSSYLSGYHSGARVVAFSKGKEDTGFLKTPEYETYGSTLLTSSVDVNSEKDGMVYRSAMQKRPNVLSGEYDAPNNTMYGLTPVILEYYLGNDIELERLSFHELEDGLARSMRYYYTVPFSGNMYFYNYNTGSYDSMAIKGEGYGKEELAPYLSPGNTLTVKYVYDASGDYTWNIMLPILTVTGRSK